MKEKTREIGIGDKLYFPSDIQYIFYNDVTLAVAVDTANWIVLKDDISKQYLEALRSGETVGEVLSHCQRDGEKASYIKLLSAIMARQFAGLDVAPVPNYVQGHKMLNIYLTNACNLHCTHCFMKAGKKLENELDKDDWIRVLDEFTQAGGQAVTFTGGEPLMYPDFEAIIKAAYRNHLQITVLTNGILWTNELIDELSSLIAEVQVSIDGVDDVSNAKVRTAGTFNQLVENVIRFSSKGVRVSVATTFTNDNIDSADQYVKLVKKINEATDNQVIFKLTKKLLPGRNIYTTLEENRAYEARIRKIEDAVDPNAKYEAFMDGHTPNLVARNCGFGGLSIAADGNVFFCNRLLEINPQGNVKDNPMSYFIEKGQQTHIGTGVDEVDPCRNCPVRYICGGGCRIDEYDFKGKSWHHGQVLQQIKCKGPSDYLLKMMVESYGYKYSF